MGMSIRSAGSGAAPVNPLLRKQTQATSSATPPASFEAALANLGGVLGMDQLNLSYRGNS